MSGFVSNGGVSNTTSKMETGFVYGGGIETMFAPNWSAKIEYLHLDLGDGPVASNNPIPARPTKRKAGEPISSGAGLNYKFGAPVSRN